MAAGSVTGEFRTVLSFLSSLTEVLGSQRYVLALLHPALTRRLGIRTQVLSLDIYPHGTIPQSRAPMVYLVPFFWGGQLFETRFLCETVLTVLELTL